MGKEDCLKIVFFFLKKEKTNKFHCTKMLSSDRTEVKQTRRKYLLHI